jgi:hypothetical protein
MWQDCHPLHLNDMEITYTLTHYYGLVRFLEGNRFYALDHIQNEALTHSVALPTKTAICDILPDGVNGCVGPCHGSRR